MQNQTITQTLNIVVGNTPANGNLANTGSQIKLLPIIAIILITLSLLTWYLTSRRLGSRYKLKTRSLGVFLALSLAVVGLTINSHFAQATPTLTLGTGQNNINVTIPNGGGSVNSTTNLTTGTVNSSGYTLTAQLQSTEPGIAIGIKGGEIATNTTLVPNATPLTLKTTSSATSNDTTEATLYFTIDDTVTAGTKQLQLTYNATDNPSIIPPAPTTMQELTSSYCQDNMTIYDGSNNEAILTLTDARGDNQTYQVAKLADNNCWMLNNLKLGSNSGTTLLTPQDTDITSNFTLPQLYSGSDSSHASFDTPEAYNIPTALRVTSGWEHSTSGTWSLNISTPISTTVGPFPYDVDGDTVATALTTAVGQTVTTSRSSQLDGNGTTAFTWSTLDNSWNITIDTSNLVQNDGPGISTAEVTNSDDYGNLYNWPAVTAGESRTSHDENAGNAPHSICPKNWRLPIGGIDTNTGIPLSTNEFNELSAKMAGFPNGQDPTYLSNYGEHYQNWQPNGPFKGQFAGLWNGGFGDQGGGGGLWSSSAFPDTADNAFLAVFFSGFVLPGHVVDRAFGIGVRCLL
ncbi:MAG: hypothetical protein H6793_00735 [Candidatus Nomurabacteria bacterium]|nr:MAG: hypothetical protein H6793_00735 [Candidatus Nomurabacteria bacterium]